VEAATVAAWHWKRVRSRRARPPRRCRRPPPTRAPLAGGSAGKPSPQHHGRGAECPRARTDAAIGGIGEGPGPCVESARTGARSGPSDDGRGAPPGRAKTRGQKASAGGNPSAARSLRTWRRRLAVM